MNEWVNRLEKDGEIGKVSIWEVSFSYWKVRIHDKDVAKPAFSSIMGFHAQKVAALRAKKQPFHAPYCKACYPGVALMATCHSVHSFGRTWNSIYDISKICNDCRKRQARISNWKMFLCQQDNEISGERDRISKLTDRLKQRSRWKSYNIVPLSLNSYHFWFHVPYRDVSFAWPDFPPN